MRERQKRFLRCSSNFFRRKTSTYLPWSVYFKLFMEFVAHDKVVCHTEPVRLHRVVGTVVHGTDLRIVKVRDPVLALFRHDPKKKAEMPLLLRPPPAVPLRRPPPPPRKCLPPFSELGNFDVPRLRMNGLFNKHRLMFLFVWRRERPVVTCPCCSPARPPPPRCLPW